jgi:hypothetical protein
VTAEAAPTDSPGDESAEFISTEFVSVPPTEDVFLPDMDFTVPNIPMDGYDNSSFTFRQENPTSYSQMGSGGYDSTSPHFGGEIMGLGGMSETLPPMEVLEDL